MKAAQDASIASFSTPLHQGFALSLSITDHTKAMDTKETPKNARKRGASTEDSKNHNGKTKKQAKPKPMKMQRLADKTEVKTKR